MCFGRRLWKEVGGARTYYLYADEGLVGEYDNSGTEIKTYGYKPGSTWTTDPLFMKQDGQYYFYQNDHLGTPQRLTAGNGAVAWSAKYSSFGRAEVDPASTITNNLRFPGQYYDEETGLHYNYYRYYNPTIGRYITQDPIGLIAGINLLLYTSDNPVNFADPLGLLDRIILRRPVTTHEPPDGKWMFIGWRIHDHETTWYKWRTLWAQCKNLCTGEIEDVHVIYEMWRPWQINTPSLSLPGAPGGPAGADTGVNKGFDLFEATLEAEERGIQNKSDVIMKEGGQKFCDQLPE